MPPDAVRLRAQLARHLNHLYQLQVIEAAEDVVRQRHLQLLASQLAGLTDELVCARERLDTARTGSDLRLIIEAEEHMCDILRETTLTQREASEHIRASKRAHNLYLAKRGRLKATIDQLRRRIIQPGSSFPV